jgi:acyl carrier protein
MSDLEKGFLTNVGHKMVDILTEGEIFARLSLILQDALRIEPAKVTPNARLFLDLGAESLDLLDIRFRVDEAFGFKTKEEELIRSLGDGLGAAEIEEKLTVRSVVLYIRNCVCEKPKTS